MSETNPKDSPKSSIRPRTIVAYRGGGYDGCIWEWNYAFFDQELQFHDVFSSGCMGCRTSDEFFENAWPLVCPEDVYHLGSEEDVARLLDHEPLHNVLRLAAWFSRYPELEAPELFFFCNCCGGKVSLAGFFDEQDVSQAMRFIYQGFGGLTYFCTEIWCPDCTAEHTCHVCESLVIPPDSLHDGVCPDCLAEVSAS